MDQRKNSNILLEDHVCRRLKVKICVLSDFKSMLPLYFLRTASFIKEATLFSDGITDAGVFERMKNYLIERWDFYKNKSKKITIEKQVL